MEDDYYRIKLKKTLWINLKEIANQEGVTRQDLIDMVLTNYANLRLQKEYAPAMVDGLSVLVQRELENTKLLQQVLRQQTTTLNYLRVVLGAEDYGDDLKGDF